MRDLQARMLGAVLAGEGLQGLADLAAAEAGGPVAMMRRVERTARPRGAGRSRSRPPASRSSAPTERHSSRAGWSWAAGGTMRTKFLSGATDAR